VRTGGEAAAGVFGAKTRALLAYLACSPARTASREHLMSVLWADNEPERARHRVRQAIWHVRHTLGESALLVQADDLVLGPEVEVDRDLFLAALDCGDLERAVTLYTGEFLPHLAVPGGEEFEQWAVAERERLRSAFVRAAETQVRRWLASMRVKPAQQLARRLRDADPRSESGWRLLLGTLIAGDDQLTAVMEADAMERAFAAEGRELEPATRAVLRVAREGTADTASPDARHTLVAELIGREREFAAVVGAWDEVKRGKAWHFLVSAPPGLGKTRLLADVRARLRAGGARVVYLRARPGGRRIAFSFASDLAKALGSLPGAAGIPPGAAASLVALHPSLSSGFAVAADDATGDEALRRRTIALSELVEAVAEDAPLALLLDDLHWLDPSSRDALSGVLSRAEECRVLVVTASRPSRQAALDPGWAERLTLEPLTPPEVSALVASLGALPAERWGARLPELLHASTGGSPLLVLETLQLAVERGTLRLEQDAWHCPDPAALEAELGAGGALRTRLEQLDREQRWMLLLLSLIGSPASSERLARAAQREVAQCMPVLEQLERRGLVVQSEAGWEVAHDELAALAVSTATAGSLRAANAGVGRMFAAEAEVEPELALRAGPCLAAAGDAEHLVPLFAKMAASARRRGDRRSDQALADELLGESATRDLVAMLVASLPRRGLSTWARRAAVALLVLGTAVGLAALTRPDPHPEPVLLVMSDARSPGREVAAVTLHRERWDISRAIVVGRGAARAHLPPDLPPTGYWSVSPDGRAWAFSLAVPDSGAEELFVASGDDPPRRLTGAPGDDDQPSWSPDGRRLTFRTARYSDEGWQEVAVLDLATGATRRATRGASYVATPYWSPDGTRIAFVRWAYDGRQGRICWTTPAVEPEHCALLEPYSPIALRGWHDPDQVLAVLDSAGERRFARVSLATGEVTILERDVLDVSVSPDGQWAACLCRRGVGATAEWLVYPVDEPGEARRVRAEPQTGSGPLLAWGAGSGSREYLERLTVEAPPVLPVGTPIQLSARGADRHGQPVTLHTLTWWSADTSVLTVGPTGLVRPKRTGTASVFASAGGWRVGQVTLSVQPIDHVTVLAESWNGDPSAEWMGLGPMPRSSEGPGGVRAVRLRRDGGARPGVYTRSAFRASRGLGVEVRLPSLLAGGASIWLGPAGVGAPVTREDAMLQSCGLAIPPTGVPRLGDRLTLWSGRATSAASLAGLGRGGWHTVRLQMFADGRCGVAVDGIPVWLSAASPLPLEQPMRLVIENAAQNTEVMVGPVEVWEGVRGGIDWSIAAEPRN
jgi:DNA-binding SARP family transcriptional activator